MPDRSPWPKGQPDRPPSAGSDDPTAELDIVQPPTASSAPTSRLEPPDTGHDQPTKPMQHLPVARPANRIPRLRLAVVLLVVLLVLATGALAGAMIANRRPASTRTPPTGTAPAQAPTSSVQAAQPTQPTVPGESQANVRVENQGFMQLRPDAGGESRVAYAVLVTNPRADQVATDVRVHITFTDRAGRLRKTKDKDLDVLLPGQTGAVADDSDVGGAARMRVEAFVGRWQPAPGAAGRLTVTDVRTVPTAAGAAETTATLHSTFATDITDAKAVAVYYNQAGQIVGGESSDLDVIPAGRAIGLLIESKSPPPGIAKTEIYTTLKDLSSLG